MKIKTNELKYCYNDLSIVPAAISTITSRSECNPFYGDDMLPIFTAPMATITNIHNIDIWKENHIMPIIPRNVFSNKLKDEHDNILYRYNNLKKYLINGDWVALSLKEFTYLFASDTFTELDKDVTYRVCVDLANGHMQSLYRTINYAKKLAHKRGYTLIIMTGNIANPETYKWICENAEVDYIRVSIGSGFNCITSTQTAIHYPVASLINECAEIQANMKLLNKYDVVKSVPYIVADGGIRGYSDVIKALALGANYVMIGSEFTRLLESAGKIEAHEETGTKLVNIYGMHDSGEVFSNHSVHTIFNIWSKNTSEDVKRDFIGRMKTIYKTSYGMSTKMAQDLINPNAKKKTSEGCIKKVEVKETIKQWSDNMISYLKSAMSYTSKRDIKDFVGRVDLVLNSNNTVNSINK